MLERRSALASATPYKSAALGIAERPGFSLTQVAGLDAAFEEKLSSVVGPLPEKVGAALQNGAVTVMRIGPVQFWLVEPEQGAIADRLSGVGAVTPLSNSRVRIALEGGPARAVLAKLVPVDLHPAVFTPGSFVLSGIHHTPVTVHCTAENNFDVYAMRSFAHDVWEAVTDAALEFC